MKPYEKKGLLNINEFCEYLSIGKSKGRELLRDPSCCYVVRIGYRYYANKKLLDDYLEKCARYHLEI